MRAPVSDIAFTPAVKAAQERLGSRPAYANSEKRGGWSDVISPELEAFIAERDSLYLGTASADGQPYIQHRGGPKGFVKVLDESTLAFADFSGNSQYISLGNLSENPKAYIFFMDYANRRRIKIWGTARFVEGDPTLVQHVTDPDYGTSVERVLVFHVLAWDRNCNLHITQRFTEEELTGTVREKTRRASRLSPSTKSSQRRPIAAMRKGKNWKAGKRRRCPGRARDRARSGRPFRARGGFPSGSGSR